MGVSDAAITKKLRVYGSWLYQLAEAERGKFCRFGTRRMVRLTPVPTQPSVVLAWAGLTSPNPQPMWGRIHTHAASYPDRFVMATILRITMTSASADGALTNFGSKRRGRQSILQARRCRLAQQVADSKRR